MTLAQRTKKIAAPGTSRMRTIANELKAQGLHIVNFAAGELDGDTSDAVKQGARQAIDAGKNIYTPTMGAPELRKQLGALVSQHTGVAYAHDEVGLTAGAKQALYNAAMVLLDPDDEVIIPNPYWVTFPTQVELAQGRPVFIETRDAGYQLMASQVEQAITPKTKALIINTPNNPSGAVYQAAQLAKIAALALQHDFWIIFDECYAALVRGGHQHAHILAIEPRLKERIVLVNSFSKSHALTGWRLGYVAAPAPVMKAMENLQGHTTSNPSSVAQYAISYALAREDGQFIARVNRTLDERLRRALAIVAEMPSVQVAQPQGAFYLFLDISAHLGKQLDGTVIADVDQFCEAALREARIAMVSGAAFGDPSSVRISYAISTDDVVEGLQRLRQLLQRLQ
ncbi:pyridoxal phosphate-dependent aminotransferase [Massilia eburnea]|uniref:pyridoxal phosphate-dependent aminotransferase n=1 Tax=Massilia eburnea TaxID=1776165 RepID=UPI003D6A4F9C